MSVRRACQLLHRWTGLTAAAFLLLAGLSGSIIAFDDELDAWINADVWYVEPGAQKLPLRELIARVEASYPEGRVFFTPLAQRRDESQRVRLAPRPDKASTLLADEVWIDPYRGTILAERSSGLFRLDRRHLIPFLYRFHYTLTLGEAGMLLTGTVALIWLATTLFGIYLAWPRRGRWRQALSIRWSAGWLPALYDAHRAGGIVLGAMFMLIAFSGFCMNVAQVSVPVVNLFSNVRGWPIDAMPERPVAQSALDVDALLVRARDETSGAEPSGVIWNYQKRVVTVELERSERTPPGRELLLYYDMLDGRRLAAFDPRNATAGEGFLLWQLPLHGGDILGLPGRSLIALLGLLLPALVLAGVLVWFRKRRASPVHRGMRR